MEYLKAHLRPGSHDRIGTVRTVANDDILAAVFLKLHIVLDLPRAIAWP